ncbi:hypothetical protein [Laspinema olomoucense]|uniref:Cysteinyl-tRNA synthetase n=1 Tax=Laspinema olomoucense D3b TaxID=2953688 RepID=A0ABT2N8Q2_9CYAN|nr:MULTISPECIES: hypothetical protein [unclassified Laspinema]MCT7975502.1 hypothetical protein [Laspinema sp. D3d]MCT7978120.1 hypothetical protein [Laspinema sp. D3b]MCT7991471.1 hypothetical protein [Laspinema sp. D3a]MCT7995024.1 hypothetical protein [Laspinema sp. D3c]
MMDIQVDSLTFSFPDSWEVSKYDEWAFYRNQFSRMLSGIKAVDLIAIEGPVIWLIEAKDYRQQSRTKTLDLAEEVADKVLCTLAAMLPAKLNASDSSERNFAAQVVRGKRLQVVLHLEQPVTHSRLFPRAIDPSKVQLKLRTLIKPIDPHPKVVESTQMQGLPWTVK